MMASSAISDVHKRIVQQERALERHFEVPTTKRTDKWLIRRNELVNALRVQRAAWLALVQLQPRQANLLTTERKRLENLIDYATNLSFKRLMQTTLTELTPQLPSVARTLTSVGGRESTLSQIPSAEELTLPQDAEVDLSFASVPSYSTSQRQTGRSSMSSFQRKNSKLSELAKRAGEALQAILDRGGGGGGAQYENALKQYRILRRGLITRARQRGDGTSSQLNFETQIPEDYVKVLMGVAATIRESLGLDRTMWIARFPQLLNYATFDAELKHVQETLNLVEHEETWTQTRWNDVQFGERVLAIWAANLQAQAIASQDARFQAAVNRLLLEAQAIPGEILRLSTQYEPPRSVSVPISRMMAATPLSAIQQAEAAAAAPSVSAEQLSQFFGPPPPTREEANRNLSMAIDALQRMSEELIRNPLPTTAALEKESPYIPPDTPQWRRWLEEHPYAVGLGAAGLGATGAAATLARYGPLAAVAAGAPIVPPPTPPAGFLARTAQQVGNTVLGWFGTAKDTAIQAAEKARAAAIAYPYAVGGALALGAAGGAAALVARRMRAAEVKNVGDSIQRVSRSAATHPHLSARQAAEIDAKLRQSATLTSQYAVTGNPAALAAAKQLVRSAAHEERVAPKPKRRTTRGRRRRSTFSLQRRTRMTTRTKRASAPSRLTAAAKPKRSSGGRRRGRSGRSAARTRRL